ncbi:hypothetical protein RB597_003700 [Gaeumannomyces tritici]
MSADDQVFLDVLSAIPNDIKRYSTEVADFVDKHVEVAAGMLREQLSTADWIPESFRPRPLPPTPSAQLLPLSAYERLEGWVLRHKFLTGLIVLGAGTAAYRTYHKQYNHKPRRARRSRNGGRVEVVVIAGKPSLPLVKSLALDLERRGHIVFIVCNSVEEDAIVQSMQRSDIKPLAMDIADPPLAGASIERFAQYLHAPHPPTSKPKPIHLSLKAVILVPSVTYQTSPIATIPPSSFADLFHTHLLHPILTIQSFLPLLTARPSPPPVSPATAAGATPAPSPTATSHNQGPPKVIVFTPSIVSSINPPFHAPEATVCSALSAFTEVLTAELRPLSIPVTHVQLGTFDLSDFTPALKAGAAAASRAAGLLTGPDPAESSWPESARNAYGRNYTAQSTSVIGTGTAVRGLRGTSLRELHTTVFDIISADPARGGPPESVRVGLGADLYGFVGRWVPRGLVAWMMGVRKVDNLAAWQPSPSMSGTPRSGSESGEFVAVPGGDSSFVTEHDVWK